MNELKMILMVLVMAGVTYVLRVAPMVIFRKKITSVYINSLLYYIPYAVLSAMTFPYILYSTGNIYTAIAGTATGIIAVLFRRGLLTVAVISCVTVFIMNFILNAL